jgi:acetate kinase
MRVLAVNAGSSSLKLSLLDEDDALLDGRSLPPPTPAELRDQLDELLDRSGRVEAVGHRVVHGGARFNGPVVLGERIDEQLEELSAVAPLHNHAAMAAVGVVAELRPDLPQVACFDTAFHATIPPAAAQYAVPAAWRDRWAIRRYGFHGLSHAWAARRGTELLSLDPHGGRLVTAHLGAGASLAAVVGGRSVDTTMGFTPLEGLVMATRSGTVDPGLVLFLVQQGGLSPAEVEEGLEKRAGLLGLAGRGGDLRAIMEDAERGVPAAVLAYGVYLHRLVGLAAAMAATMGGVDGLVFTGGAGEHSVVLRRDVCRRLAFFGISILEEENEAVDGDGELSTFDSRVKVAVVAAREDLEIASQVRRVLAGGRPPDEG